MHAISNMVDICGAKVHKLATHYGTSNLAGGKPRLSSINGWLLRYLPIYEFTFMKQFFLIILLPCLECIGVCLSVCVQCVCLCVCVSNNEEI